MGVNCANTIMNDDNRPKDQDRIDGLIESIGTVKTIDELDPTQNNLGLEQLTKFLAEFDPTYMKRTDVKGPDFLISDDFAYNFELEKADLVNARKEAEFISEHVCSQILSSQQEPSARCDNLTWLKGLESDLGFK